ncbi:uncharacterized protein F4822DRAFT_290931 [Hypoxylon trugodes]|uniref:uncharacterized protein n=1 Tax=Hypoxylon trugodes TaxID=326681 RepID=UPI00218D72B3|nr:uncharacterized protein F4822DRAFT_290931 [Hypoxylon trugodes]KAI1387723.1 hypothetical protein F4822DRAFT_290931 [Hypoxylon trugodes]
MGMVEFTPEKGKDVEDFVRSPNFITCIQIQSFFFTGYLYTWFRVVRQAFPEWFDEQLYMQYCSAITEWGYLLTYHAHATGRFPGQIDQCLWGALGTSNFMHGFPSKFKSYALEMAGSGCANRDVLLYDKLIFPSMEILVL